MWHFHKQKGGKAWNYTSEYKEKYPGGKGVFSTTGWRSLREELKDGWCEEVDSRLKVDFRRVEFKQGRIGGFIMNGEFNDIWHMWVS